jgi:hypothetical protein
MSSIADVVCAKVWLKPGCEARVREWAQQSTATRPCKRWRTKA